MNVVVDREKEPALQTTAEEHLLVPHSRPWIERSDLIRITLVSAVVLICFLKVPYCHWFAVAGTLAGGWPIFEEALSNLREKRMTMELSMSIALLAALAISESFTALVITLFVLIAEALEGLTVGRGRNALRELVSMMPEDAFVREGDSVKEKKVSELAIGDVVVIKPGARVPVDGKVISGHSFIDQSSITGESVASEKIPGTIVYAGTINQSGTIDVLTADIGPSTAFGKIIHAIETSESNQAPIQKIADRLAGYLVYFAIVCAVLTFLITQNVQSTISVIIVAGACGIAAGTPLAILGGVGRAAKMGSIVKGGLFLELLSTIDTIVFDKTGTVTKGEPAVIAIHNNGVSEDELLQVAATAESVSEHPLGQAIILHARARGIEPERPERFSYEPGRGIACTIRGEEVLVGNRSWLENYQVDLARCKEASAATSEVVVARNGQYLGTIFLADELRSESKQAISQLEQMGIRPVLLTGDSKVNAKAIANQLNIDEIAAEVLPHEKQLYVRKLIQSGRKTAMVGDGINDAPALMEATVGVAIGSGTDAARESADIVLIGNDLSRLVETVKIARQCRRIILTNFAGTLLVDGAGVLLAAFGLLNPPLAAFIHVGSELLFILNSARLLPGHSAEGEGK